MKVVILFFMVGVFLISCQNKHPELITDTIISLTGISGGSGIIEYGDRYLIVGDDSPYLFECDTNGVILQKVLLMDLSSDSTGRIEKALKPDFEAMEKVMNDTFIILGSGSRSPERDVFLFISLRDSFHIQAYDVKEFYDFLRSHELMNNEDLNIEAAAVVKGHLYIFNRKPNIIFELDWQNLHAYLQGLSGMPKISSGVYALPEIHGVEAGFSGATGGSLNSQLFITASVEKTPNAYDDGPILGSFVGSADVIPGQLPDSIHWHWIPFKNEKYKVESVVIKKHNEMYGSRFVFITDEDNGQSHMIKATLAP